MITEITKIESIKIKKFGDDAYFVYFDFLGREEKTIITKKVQDYLKFNILKVGDKINVQKGFKNNNIKFIITEVLKNE